MDMSVYVSVSALLRRGKDLCFAVRKMKKVKKNACLRHGCFTYSISLDNNYLSLEPEAAYDAKSAFIQRTADDLSSVIRRAPYSEVICTASHVYQFDLRIADGFERQPHIYVFWYSRDYR